MKDEAVMFAFQANGCCCAILGGFALIRAILSIARRAG
jgi:hypothetical protein